MSARIAKSNPAMKLILLFTASLSWAFQQQAVPPKYQYRDPVTSELLMCDQCPPGTAVKQHCTADTPTECEACPERHFAENWHWGDTCQYCTSVCKERQLVKQQCNSTHDQLCECAPGFHLVVEFCITHSACPPGHGVTVSGTPVSDTVCKRCPPGYFSTSDSATEPCQPHRNCSDLGLKTLRWGTSTTDSLCGTTTLECSQHQTVCHNDVTLCEEAVYQSLSSLRLSSVPLERLLESLPGRRVDRKSLERLKKVCSPQQQVLQLLRLWREQNKDQDKLYGIIQGVNHCERKVSRCNSLKNLTLDDLLKVTNSLPGVKVQQEDVQAVVSTCLPRQYILQLLHLWKSANYDLDLAKGLSHSLRVMRSQGAPRYLLRGLKRISRIIGTTSAHKMFRNMLQDDLCFKAHKPLNE
ncbi:Tumor necrosis factor receptor superfamily member 11B Osteoprotegerin Precursor [Larimichthys crocea]|uniref:Tumor necrosis factor receptor superfamily member 11B Osteoprotegerin n=2 Tax=Larimichthys crocea TaxID=215358 RepID=A0A6G0IB96_LARCR|nr:tumor necrosis factor receptor superfamily member 11B [Larimichthys crocea]KAE8288573.1 Tumor necrosis factor receptor superfamily member 11B Osteoprotegerin Precursor [Larimichthys crocea]TMS10389.1 Tumor necrosis factor receptor superfamily member 11B [Larimichthys crocea]